MARFRVSHHQTWQRKPERGGEGRGRAELDVPDHERPVAATHRTRTEAWLEEWFGSPRTGIRVLMGATVALMLFGTAVLANAMADPAGPDFVHAAFEPVAPEGSAQVYVASGYATDYPVDVLVMKHRLPNADFVYNGARILIPSTELSEPAYGLRVKLVRLDPDVQPILLWAEPDKGGRIIPAASDDGVTAIYDVFQFREAGRHRLVLSSDDGGGGLDLRMQLAGAAALGPAEAASQSPMLLIGAGSLLASLALVGLLGTTRWKQRPPVRAATRQTTLMETPAPARDGSSHQGVKPLPQPEVGTDGFARMEYGTAGVARWSKPGDGVPEALADGQTKGWVIRLD